MRNMDATERERLERDLRARFDAGDLEGTVEAAIRAYGPEILGLLTGLHRDEQEAAEVFSAFTERLWRGLGRFAWQCSFRTWAYTIAHNASRSHRHDARLRARRYDALPEGSALVAAAEQVRSGTAPYLRSAVKDGFARLRESLAPDDQVLLTLRIDKELSWNELAQVLHDADEPLDDEALKRASARLRQRFQKVKRELVERGRREGLLGDGRS